ncbi:hypothetical protein HPL003_05005 [Paenibacillus terrae HPL-003]|uniref:Uncharacterized protein n=1 Tax=Paenibacillus terrae (strain HPL-003) TaxID=985665 RepID=G7VWU9_PAETH|nr:hypothetical protein HPL003_05005 [Paenibacillus terrae HPL-003]
MIHGVDTPSRYRFQKLHCSYHIYSYVLWQEKDFANPNPSTKLKKSACCSQQNGFLIFYIFFDNTCFSIEYQG